MHFYIRKDSTLPILVLEQVFNGETDFDFNNSLLANCAVTFSMINIDTGVYKIANKAGNIAEVKKVHPDKTDYPYEYFIYYEWEEEDVNQVGTYKAEFKLNFLDPSCKSLTVPIMEDLYIHIRDTITKTTVIYN